MPCYVPPAAARALRCQIGRQPSALPPLPAAALGDASPARGRWAVRSAAPARPSDAVVEDGAPCNDNNHTRFKEDNGRAGALVGSLPPRAAAARGQLHLWHAYTRRLLRLATLATVADVAASAVAQATSGPAVALCGGWVALSSHFTSFLILTSVFVADGEAEAAACYAAGLLGSLALLLQGWRMGGAPPAVLAAALLLASGGAGVGAALLRGGDQSQAPGAAPAWRLWRGVLGATGFATLPQVVYLSVLLPASGAPGWAAAGASWGPAAVGLALFAGLALALRAGRLPRSCWEVWDAPAWAATLLFMLEPLAALAGAARDPGALAATPLLPLLLPAVVTGLQVPRALLVQDHMWCTGTSWSTACACLQAALVAKASGRAGLAAALLCAPFLGAAWLLHRHAAAEGHGSVLQTVQPIVAAYRRQLRPWRQLVARLRSSLRGTRAVA